MTQTLERTQHPVIRQTARGEFIAQLIVLVLAALLLALVVPFELAVLLLLALGFSFMALNVTAAATSTNVHLAEIRDLLLKAGLDQPDRDNSTVWARKGAKVAKGQNTEESSETH